tara:strand:+ start:10715 stop:10921 length:207 start_codon:yes stop_codon:yes gene_type:complete
LLNKFVEVTHTDSIVVLYHRGTGQTLVFGIDIMPLLIFEGSSNQLDEPQFAKYHITISTLRKFDMLED